MAGTVTVSVDQMRVVLPYFSDTDKYPDAMLTVALGNAQNYVSPLILGPLGESDRTYATYLMAGHLQLLSDKLNSGDLSVGNETSASVDRVSVSLTPPPNKNQFEFWLNQTPFGAQLLFLLNTVTGVGFFVGGSNENVFR